MKFEQEIFGENERARDQHMKWYHFNDLFDQNEDESGERIDPATGEHYKNDADIEAPEAFVSNTLNENPLVDMENDPAEKWLLKNDPDYLGKGKWKESDKRAA